MENKYRFYLYMAFASCWMFFLEYLKIEKVFVGICFIIILLICILKEIVDLSNKIK